MKENKEITIHINNMAYTLSLDEEMQNEFKKHFDLEKNNETMTLLKAYLKSLKERQELKQKYEKELLNIANKLIGY